MRMTRGQAATFTLADGRLLSVVVVGSTACDVSGDVLTPTGLELFSATGRSLSWFDLAAFLARGKRP